MATPAIATPDASKLKADTARMSSLKPQATSAITPLPSFSSIAGNMAIQRLVAEPLPLQRKLTIGSVDDPLEHEADRVADQVVHMPESVESSDSGAAQIRGRCACGGTCPNCKADGIDAEHGILQRKPAGPTPVAIGRASPAAAETNAAPIVHEVLRSRGQALPSSMRSFFEPRFGFDLSQVRVHTDSTAQQSAEEVNAKAYTVGQNVVFGTGRFTPETTEGRRLLAHELTHVVQQERSPRRVQRQSFFSLILDDKLDPDATPESLYASTFGWVSQVGVDKASAMLGKKLHLYVLTHPDPYQFIKKVFALIPSKWEDNVAADFMSKLADMELYQFARSDAGRDLLDMLYEAMITGDVSDFERYQSARIEQFGLRGAVARQNPLALFDILANESSPRTLIERFLFDVLDRGRGKASHTLAQGLRAYIDVRPNPYPFLRTVFKALPSSYEDNVAADFVGLMDNARLESFAAPAESRSFLDILYEAMITGDVSPFQRFEAERILQVKNAQTPVGVFQEYQNRRRIFPVKFQKFLRDCYAPLRAELLQDGRIKAWYTSVRIWQCDEFKQDVATLGVSSSELTRGIYLKSDELVSVRLYDGDDQTPRDIPALGLIDYSNQSKNKTLALAQQAFLAGLTLPLGGLPATAGARALAIADRFAWGISVVAALVNDNREWIAKLPGGKALVDAVDSVNRLAGYYGWSRLGVEGLRLAGGTLRRGWEAWRAATPKPPLSADQAAAIQSIEHQVDTVLDDVAKLDEQATARAADDVKPGAPEQPKRAAPGEGVETPQPKVAPDPRVAQRAKETAEEALKLMNEAKKAAAEAKAAIMGRGGPAYAMVPSVALLLARAFLTPAGKLFARTYFLIKSRRLQSFEAFVRRLEAAGEIPQFAQMSAVEQQVIRDTFTEAFRAIANGERLYANQIWSRLSKRARNTLGRDTVDLGTAEGRARDMSTDDIVAALEAEAVPQGRVAPVIEPTRYLPPHPQPGQTQVIVSQGRIGNPPRLRPGGEGKYPLGRDVGLPGHDRYHLEGVMTVGDELNIVYATSDFNRRVTAAIEKDIRGLQGDLYFEFSANCRIVGEVQGVTIKVVESITWKVQRRVLGTDKLEVIVEQTARP